MSTGILILLIVLDAMFIHERILKKTVDRPGTFNVCAFVGLLMGILVFASTAVDWVLYNKLLLPLGLAYLDMLAFLLVAIALIALAALYLKKSKPAYDGLLGKSLPLLSVNCALFGVGFQCAIEGLAMGAALLQGLYCGLGLLAVMLIMPGVFEHIDAAPIPKSFRGLPVALLTAGIMYIAFSGIQGLFS